MLFTDFTALYTIRSNKIFLVEFLNFCFSAKFNKLPDSERKMESKNIATNISNQSMITQAQIREQSTETVSAIADLNSWTIAMKQKDKDELKNASNKASNKEVSVEQQVGNLEVSTNIPFFFFGLHIFCTVTIYFFYFLLCFNEKIKQNLLPPIRSDVESTEQYQSNLIMDPKKKADVFKESGNRVLKETQNHSEALIYYTKAIDCYNKDATYFLNRAICYMKIKNYKDSLDDLNSALELNAKYCKGNKNR
jgi:tetratricopeptide (TPR) repeat protein